MSFFDRVQVAAKKVGTQASAFGNNVAQMADQGGKQLQSSLKLEGECQKAAKILQSFVADPDHPESALNSIPKAVLLAAKGLAIFQVVKAGFVWSGRIGSGIVIARLPDGSWSAPSCIGTGGIGFGLQIGADISDFVVVLNSDDAVRAFAKSGNMTIGGNLSAAAGPIGTGGAVNTSLLHPAPLFTYSKSKGLFAGVSLEGTALVERKDANEAFFGQRIPSIDILAGKVPPPEVASELYDIIEAAESLDESGLPQEAYVPQSVAPGAAAPPPPAGFTPNSGEGGGVVSSGKPVGQGVGGGPKPLFDESEIH